MCDHWPPPDIAANLERRKRDREERQNREREHAQMRLETRAAHKASGGAFCGIHNNVPKPCGPCAPDEEVGELELYYEKGDMWHGPR